jgi:hypothetical protein
VTIYLVATVLNMQDMSMLTSAIDASPDTKDLLGNPDAAITVLAVSNDVVEAEFAADWVGNITDPAILTPRVLLSGFGGWSRIHILPRGAYTTDMLLPGSYVTAHSSAEVTIARSGVNGSILTMQAPGNTEPVSLLHTNILAGKVMGKARSTCIRRSC